MIVHYIPQENLWIFIGFLRHLHFLLVQRHLFILSANYFGKGIWGSPEWQRELPEKWPQEATSTLNLNRNGRNWYTAFIWKVTNGTQLVNPDMDRRTTYNGVRSASTRGSLATLLSLPQCHTALGTIPSTLAWVDQNPVSQRVS